MIYLIVLWIDDFERDDVLRISSDEDDYQSALVLDFPRVSNVVIVDGNDDSFDLHESESSGCLILTLT